MDDNPYRLAAVEFVAVYLLSHHLAASPEARANAQRAVESEDLSTVVQQMVNQLREGLPHLPPDLVAVHGTDEAELYDQAVGNLFRRALRMLPSE